MQFFCKLRGMSITYKKWLARCAARRAAYRRLSSKGWTNLRIAKKYRISAQRVGQILKQK